MLRRISLTFTAIFIAVGLLSACTPEQLQTYQAVTGNILSPQKEGELLALKDHPMKLADGTVIELDGSVTAPTPCDISKTRINGLIYSYNDPAPAMEAFKAVAICRGWTDQEISSWLIAAKDIMAGESGFCPNLLRGAQIQQSNGCVLETQGKYGDAGFAQLIGIHYRYTKPGTGWLCGQEGLCSKWDIIATPWNSMTAFQALIERSGTAGWCFSSWARRYHRVTCNNPGMDV